ncbi:sugar ABC transporter substrate-binding protein [Nocardioides sp. LHD-245]|uniref:sugar ABC transporter substrate-binding protein n=1 Tax=Nocardioides sp. LHD-245 TaxID=3051387 RepID=UPI0027E06439|nr:sugar ABC transporter substrate-binding protein [Nocardioides sp. LHD-245]
MRRSRIRRCGLAVAAATVVLAAAGCADGAQGSGTDDVLNETVSADDANEILDELGAGPAEECTSGEGLTIGYAAVWSSNAGGKAGNDAFKAAAEACGATAMIVEAKADDPLNTMITAMDQIVAQKADAVSFFPLSADVMTAPSERAVAAGIPVVAGEVTNFDGAATTFHQDRLTASVNAARLLCQKFPDGGDLIYGAYGNPQQDLIDMQARFEEELDACSDGDLSVVGTYANKTDDIAGGLSTAQAVLQQHPDAVGVVAYSDTNAVAASRAADNLGMRDRLTIVGYNADAIGLDALAKGTIDYTFAWGLPEQQQKAVEVLIALANGEPAPKYVTVYPKCLSKSTVDEMPSIAVRTEGIALGRDLQPTGIQPLVESDEPMLEATAEQRAAVACPLD